MQELIGKEQYNRAITVASATGTVLQLAFGVKVWDRTVTKLEELAKQLQHSNLVDAGKAIETTIVMRKVHEHIIAEIAKLGGDWHGQASVQQLRAWVVFGLRAMGASRPQDPACLLFGIERFSNTNWFNSKTVGVQFLDTKETHGSRMDKETVRPNGEKRRGRLSALVTFERPKPHASMPLPPYMDIIGYYCKRRGSPSNVERTTIDLTIRGEKVQDALHPFFLGLGKYSSKPVGRAKLSAETLELLLASGAIARDSPLKAEHIRHSTLSQVDRHDNSRLPDAVARARHSVDTFKAKYRTVIHPDQLKAMKALPKSAQLELILLG